MTTKKWASYLLLAATIFLLVASAVRATSESFTVPAGQEETAVLNLVSGDHVQVSFTVTGGTNMLNFYITGPDGNVFQNFGNVGSIDYSFVCQQGGNFTLHFSNAASTQDELVSLDYEVDYYIFGMSQMLFLALVAIGICMVALAVFILTSKHP